ncbi:hypothetical protein [Methylobacterium sp. SI9]|uniref:hypothetical protein n=1 Tax=Methylobacterium guangdongense TaxID=3138811 RepID=UPI00313C6926
MSATVTRRSLGALLVLSLPTSALAKPDLAADPIFAAIEAHRETARREADIVAALARADRLGLGRTGELRADRKRLRKLRHSKRRELRRTTPTTPAGFRALAAYHASLIPDPDPDDVAGQCQRDMEAACARATG